MKKLIIIISILFFVLPIALGANTLDEAKDKIISGNYIEGRDLLKKAVSENKKMTQNATYLYLLGLCYLEEGNGPEAIKNLEDSRKKGNEEAALELGKIAFDRYDFEAADEYFSNYKTLAKKNKKAIDEEELDSLEKKMEIAGNALSRVEKITIIDSLSFPRKNFYKNFKLSDSAGSIINGKELTSQNLALSDGPAFMSETGEYLIGNRNSEGNILELVESLKLFNGQWETKPLFQEDFEKDGNYINGFMLSDGQTFYFANDGEESMGGYDLFIAQKDPLTGEFLQPLNMGMPFNSPYDDLMLAIDEEKGIGWLATDRNFPGGDITVYVFIVNEIRQNYPSDMEGIEDLAKLKNYRTTHVEGKENYYKNLLSSINNSSSKSQAEVDFILPMGNGRTYTKFSDFHNKKASETMKKYLSQKKDSEDKKLTLIKLRKAVYGGEKVNKTEIEKAEKDAFASFNESKRLLKEVYQLEKSVKRK